ncbi:MAG: amidohydrolase [Bradymonadales bacterium]|nr:amidohydrolase [Bradymonadales bacterium]
MKEHAQTRTLEHPRLYTGGIDLVRAGAPQQIQRLVVDSTGFIQASEAESQQVISLPGEAVVPGFIDTHAHLTSLGGGPGDLTFSEGDPVEAVLQQVRAAAGKLASDAWITGTGWSDRCWDPRSFPKAAVLDTAAGGRPVALFRHDRHALLASTTALKLAGYSRVSADPPGGTIQREPGSGELTGLLIDSAMDPLEAILPEPSLEDLACEVEDKAKRLASMGVTCVHEAYVTLPTWKAMCRLVEENRITVRIRAMMAPGWSDMPAAAQPSLLRVMGVKGFADGSLGSKGAQLSQPYEGSSSRGLAVQSDEELDRLAVLAKQLDSQLAVHAIGDGAVRRVLDLFDRACASREEIRLRRWRIEHAQIVHPDDLGRLTGICLATQPIHYLADLPWVADRIGTHRLAWGYRARSLMEAGAVVGFGSDFPIECGNPLKGLAALEQDSHAEALGWNRRPEQLARPVALDGYWQRAAYLAFDERMLGRLLPGFQADLVCLDADPFTAPSLDRVGVVATYVGGRCVYP